jgi:acyl-coenzyme A thioesterase PaaI-like protein
LSIEQHTKNVLEIHCERLERLYLAAPCNEYYDPGVRISEGEAEIVIPIQEKFFRVAGAVHSSICFTAMADSAVLAVNSIVEKALVVTLNFDIQLTCPIATGELIARSRFLGMSGNRYLADSVLTDSEGQELGRGNGAFMESDISLASTIGYE